MWFVIFFSIVKLFKILDKKDRWSIKKKGAQLLKEILNKLNISLALKFKCPTNNFFISAVKLFKKNEKYLW